MIKQVQFRGKDDEGNVFCQPLWGDNPLGSLEKTAAEFAPSKLHPAVREFISGVKQTGKGIYILVNALGAGEYWGSNVNGDLFPEAALVHSPPDWEKLTPKQMKAKGKKWDYGFPTFMNAYPYKHHVNKDPSRAFGEVVMAVWNPKMHRVELVVYLDRALCKKWAASDVIDRIENGEFPDVSMGCKVPYDICMICDNRSKTKKDYCIHAQSEMNRIYPDGRKVAVRNDFPKFFDISFVFIGADKSAKVLAKLAHVGDQNCLGGFCAVPRSSAEIGERFAPPEVQAQDLADLWALQKVAFLEPGAQKVVTVAPMPSGLSLGDYSKELERRRKISEQSTSHAQQTQRDALGAELLSKQAAKAIKRQTTFDGHTLKIEVDKGDNRTGKDKDGKTWSKEMKAAYGYIPKTLGKDGETVDVYLAPDPKPGANVYIVKQLKDDGSHDEDKCMLGFASKGAARLMYLRHIPAKLFGGITDMSPGGFKSYVNGHKKQASACGCGGLCRPCREGFAKLAEAFSPKVGEKSASHSKLSELIKSVPGGPFRKAYLPKLEKGEADLPNDLLDRLAGSGLSDALGAPSRLGMVLKPKEFQRIILIQIGEKPLADQLDRDNQVFCPTHEVDDLPFSTRGGGIGELLKKLLPFFGERSVAAPALSKRITIIATIPARGGSPKKVSDPFLNKVACLYNGYRRHLVKKAAVIENDLTLDPHLLPVIAGGSMAKAFAGGIEKVASVSVLSPESLAYLVGAHYPDREFHANTLRQSGVLAAA